MRVAILAIGLVFLAHSAGAASWSVIAFSTTPQNAPKVLAAGDKLMASAAGKTFKGQLILQQSVADGDNPATHAWVPIYESAAEREAFVQKLQADPVWSAFLAELGQLTKPVSTVMYRTAQSWGEINDKDTVWMTHAFRVNDPPAFVKALNAFRASPTGKAFKGQVHLSAVVAGGQTRVTHVISVGYESEAEMEVWADTRNASKEWAAYIAASRASAEYLGGSLGRNLKTWGPGTLTELTD